MTLVGKPAQSIDISSLNVCKFNNIVDRGTGLKGNRSKGRADMLQVKTTCFSLGALLVKAHEGLLRGAASLAYNIEFNGHYNNSRKSMFA